MNKQKKEEQLNRKKPKEIVVYDSEKGITYDSSDVHPEMKEMMKEFIEKNKRDPNAEVKRYVKPKNKEKE